MFAFVFPAIALAGAVIQLLLEKRPQTRPRILDVVLVWLLAVAVGGTGVFAFMGHTFRAAEVAESIGFPPDNPFQWEVAWANLAFGVLGFLCIWRRDFWWATAIGSAVYLWGAAWGHIYQAIAHDNHAVNNTGPVLYADILVPLVILVLLFVHHRTRDAATREAVTA